jgi:Tol biopolymer transport system component
LQKHVKSSLFAVWLCAFLLFAIALCCGGAEQGPPQGLVVSSVLVDPKEYTADGGRYDLFLQATPGGKVTRLTNHKSTPKLRLGGAIREPLFSHSGKRVLFLADYSYSDGRRTTMTGAAPYPNTFLNLWEVQVVTKKVAPLTKGDFGWYVHGWSPDDRYVCATYQTEAGSLDQEKPIPDDIYVWDVLVRRGRKLARVPLGVDDAFWSRDGRSIIYQSGPDSNLYSVPRQGGKSRLLLRGKAGRYGYAFSPDGRNVAYVDTDIVYIADADGGKPKAILKMVRDQRSAYSPRPRWSRDGKKVAVAVFEPTVNTQGVTKLHVYDKTSGEDRVVTTLRQRVSDLIWSRDGQWLLLKTVQEGDTEKPDPETGWHTFRREGLLAVATSDGHAVTVKEPNEETKGVDWFEVTK